MIGRIGKDRDPAKQSLLRWPCPLPSDRAIPGLWQNLESKVKRTHIAAHGRSLSLTSTGYGLPPTATMLDKHRAPVAPRTPDFWNRDVCCQHTESNALPTELRDRQSYGNLHLSSPIGIRIGSLLHGCTIITDNVFVFFAQRMHNKEGNIYYAHTNSS